MNTKSTGNDKSSAPERTGKKQLDEINEKLKLFDERQKLILEKIERIDEQFDAIKDFFESSRH